MSKQNTNSKETRRESPQTNQGTTDQSRERQTSPMDETERQHDEPPREPGGEESQHGRQKKGSADGT